MMDCLNKGKAPESEVCVAAFYRFVSLPDFPELRVPILRRCLRAKLKGSILLAHEGINGTVSGSRDEIESVLSYLSVELGMGDLSPKFASAGKKPFLRMKVRLKREIVNLGIPGVDPTKEIGTYVAPEEWNALIQDPEVLLIDTRNSYETRIGSFKGALDPQTNNFREFPDYVEKNLDPAKHKKVAMFCTGGIRCEKATSYLVQKGFEHVYHLKGGVLNYLEHVPSSDSLWEGDCFVFDDRVSVTHDLEQGDYTLCHACRQPLAEQDRKSAAYRPGVSCPHCFETQTEKNRKRAESRQLQVKLAKTRGERHIAPDS